MQDGDIESTLPIPGKLLHLSLDVQPEVYKNIKG